jgi:hypothetical protein
MTEPVGGKIAALKQHASQIGDWHPSELIEERSAGTGVEKGLVHAGSCRVITLERPDALPGAQDQVKHLQQFKKKER